MGKGEKERKRGRLRTSMGEAGSAGGIYIALKGLSLPHKGQPHPKLHFFVYQMLSLTKVRLCLGGVTPKSWPANCLD